MAAAVGGAKAVDAVPVGAWRLGLEMNPGEKCWWTVLGGSTVEGVDGPVRLVEALKAFAISVEVTGLRGDGQLLTELEDVSGGKGWRLSLARLVEKDGILEVQAICVVSKARGTVRSGKIFRMQALAVEKEMRGRGLAAEALKRLQVELHGELAGTDYRRYRVVADMAACMAKEGVSFYARQGWTSRDGVWEWDSRTSPMQQREQRKTADGGRA